MRLSKKHPSELFIDASPLAKTKMSGVGHVIEETVYALVENEKFNSNYDRLVLFCCRRDKKLLIDKYKHKKITVRSLPLSSDRALNGLNYLRIMPKIDTFLGSGDYLFMNFRNFPVSDKSKSYTWIHDLAYIKYPQTVSTKLRKHLIKNIPRWIKRTHIVTISETVKKELMSEYGLENERISVIYPHIAVIHDRKLHLTSSKNLLKKYGINSRYFIVVGNIEPRKNIQRLIEACELARKDQNDFPAILLIGGGGWNNSEIYKAIHKAQNSGLQVIMPEQYVEDRDLAVLIRQSVALLHVALYEGYGLTPLEALAAGRPVVVSDINIFHETLPKIKNAIWYADPYSVKDISLALKRVLSSTKKVPQFSVRKRNKTSKELLSMISR